MSQHRIPGELMNQSMFDPFPESQFPQTDRFQVKPEQQNAGGAIASPEVNPPETFPF
jgi:hypothetical protein